MRRGNSERCGCRLALEDIHAPLFGVFQDARGRRGASRENRGVKSLRWPRRGNDRRVLAREVSLEKRAAVCERFAYTRRASP